MELDFTRVMEPESSDLARVMEPESSGPLNELDLQPESESIIQPVASTISEKARPRHIIRSIQMSVITTIGQHTHVHMKMVLQETQQLKATFPCPVDGCNLSYSRRYNLQCHIRSVHGEEHVGTTGAGRFSCHIKTCEETFYHASRLTQHYKWKHNIDISKAKILIRIA